MSNTERNKFLNYRNDTGLAPNPDNIDYGEIAIGYKKDNEAIYIKNTANGIVDFTPISIVNITYNALKELRDNSKLKPSQYYRITDFVTTVANDEEARSAGHPFDIIVLASDKDRLQEECYAIQHENDDYFANCNLAAWKIWYCLDNDNTKYMWADTVNGKGVIYRMIDEFGNDCLYDFKNIQFKRYWANGANINGTTILQGYFAHDNNQDDFSEGVDTARVAWCYTFNLVNNSDNDYSSVYDASLNSASPGALCANNIIRQNWSGIAVSLNNIVFLNTPNYNCTNNRFGNYCNSNSFGNNCSGNIFGDGCHDNIFGNSCRSNSFDDGCHDNIFGNNSTSNSFGNNDSYNRFGNSCTNNSFGNNCSSNTFGGDCTNNSFGNNCSSNTFEDSCDSNSFGNDCSNNTFGYDCDNNTFGNSCSRNTFGYGCGNNTFGNNCLDNTFGNECRSNSFGNDCSNNSFGSYCYDNSFGNNCRRNTFGDVFHNNALGNDIQYIEIPTEKIYHTQILNGTKGTEANKLTLEFTPETTYSQFAGFTSDGVLKIWVEADAPHDTVDGGSY